MIIIIATMNIKGFVMNKEQFLSQLFDEFKARSGTRDGIVVRFGGRDYDVKQKSKYTRLPVLLRLLADILEQGEQDVEA